MKKLEPKQCEYCHNLFKPRLSISRFCCISCSSSTQPKGENSPLWKGGHHNWKLGSIRHHQRGYIEVWTGEKWVGQHRLIMEKKLGRKLLHTEHVHHKNGVTYDNRLSNLVVLSNSDHNRLEKPKQVLKWERNKKGQWV